MAGSQMERGAFGIVSSASQVGCHWLSCSRGVAESNPSLKLTAPTPARLFVSVRAVWRGAAA